MAKTFVLILVLFVFYSVTAAPCLGDTLDMFDGQKAPFFVVPVPAWS